MKLFFEKFEFKIINSNFGASNFDGHSFLGFMHVFTVILLLIDF